MKEDDLKTVSSIISWWHRIKPGNEYDAYAGQRAELRRCHSIDEVVFVPAYHTLLEMTEADRNKSELLKALAVEAMVLSQIEKESELPFAEALAKCEPQFSQIRFRRLLETKEWDNLASQLTRALRFTKNSANIESIVKGILLWNKGVSIKEQWAIDYYKYAKKD